MSAKNKLLLISLCLSFFILLFANISKANEIQLAEMASDVNSDSYSFIIDVDESDLLKSFYVDTYHNGELKKRNALAVATLIKEGLRLSSKGAITLASIHAENFNEEQGGYLIINAINNILTGKRKNYEIQLAKDKTGWKLFKTGSPISNIKALANRTKVVGIVGVKDLVMN